MSSLVPPCPGRVPAVDPLNINLSHVSHLSYLGVEFTRDDRNSRRRNEFDEHTHLGSRDLGHVGHVPRQRIYRWDNPGTKPGQPGTQARRDRCTNT